jgi:MFS family permease
MSLAVAGRFRAGLPSVGGQVPLVAALSVDAVGTGLFLPFSILFFTATTPLSVAAVGLGVSVASGLRLPLGPLLGSLVDRWGPRRVFVLSNVVQCAGTAGYLLVGSFWGLVATAFVVQAGNSAFWISYAPLVTQISQPGDRERWFGLLGALRNTGFALGGLAAGLAVSSSGTAGYRLIVAVNAASFAAAAVLLLAQRTPSASTEPAEPSAPRSPRPQAGWRAVLTDRPYAGLALVNVAYATSTLALTVLLPVYAVVTLRLPGWVPGVAFTINCVLIAAGQGPVVAALQGRRRSWALQLSALLVVASTPVMLLARIVPTSVGIATVLLGVVIFTAAELIDSPVMAALSTEAAPAHLRGRYLAIHQLSWNVASTVGPALLTALLQAGSALAWSAVAVIAAAGGLGMRRLARRLPAASQAIGSTSTPPLANPVLEPI